MSLPGGSEVKNPPASAGDMGLIGWSGRSSGECLRQGIEFTNDPFSFVNI